MLVSISFLCVVLAMLLNWFPYITTPSDMKLNSLATPVQLSFPTYRCAIIYDDTIGTRIAAIKKVSDLRFLGDTVPNWFKFHRGRSGGFYVCVAGKWIQPEPGIVKVLIAEDDGPPSLVTIDPKDFGVFMPDSPSDVWEIAMRSLSSMKVEKN